MKKIKLIIAFFLLISLTFGSYSISYLLSIEKMFFIDENYYAIMPDYANSVNKEHFTKALCEYHNRISGSKYKGKVYLLNVANGKIISIYNSKLDIYKEYRFWR